MGLLDGIGKKVSDAGQKTLQKTRELSDTARINGLIAEEEKKLDHTYYQIGKLYVSLYGKNCIEEFSGMVCAVEESEQKIMEYQKQIQNIKGIQRCEKCGAEITKGVLFCSACGTPVPRVPEAYPMEDYIKCEKCGAMINSEMRFCTVCGTPVIKNMPNALEEQQEGGAAEGKICPNCGAALAGDSLFCMECGTKL